MPLIPYEPFRRLENMKRELDRFFNNDVFKTGFGQNFGNVSLDVYETENEVVATCDIPGLRSKEDIAISIENNVLTINGTVNRVNEVTEEHIHRQERFTGKFQRSVSLPATVSEDDIKASYKNGVLEIRIPKLKTDTRKIIDVDFH